MKNQDPRKRSSRFIGVHVSGKCRKDGSPYVYGFLNNKGDYLSKLFATELEAAKWYNQTATSIFGASAKLNEIPNE